MRTDDCQPPLAAGHRPGPRAIESVRCIRLGALRGLVPIPYVALQDMAIREASPLGHHSTLPAGGRVPWACQESGPPEPPKPRLLDLVRHGIETRHYSRRTEKAYIHWIKCYIFFHGKLHPAEMGATEIAAFLTSLDRGPSGVRSPADRMFM